MMVLQWDIDTSEDVLREFILHRLSVCILSLKLPYFEYFRHRFASFTQRFPRLQDMLTNMGAEELRRSLDLATKQAEYQLDRQMDCHKSICSKET